MATYTYLICKAHDGLILDELPLSTTSLPRQIAIDTTAQFSLPLSDPRVGPQWAGLVDPRRVPLLVVLRDQLPAWAGIITGARGVQTMELEVISLEGWLARRAYPIPGLDINWDQRDQFDIARGIVKTAGGTDAFFGDNLGMIINADQTPAASGVIRDRHYLKDDPSDSLTRLQQLGLVRKGFEWTLELDYTPGGTNVFPRLVMAYPTMGIRNPSPEWRFEMGVGGKGGNVVDYDVQIDCSLGKFATEVSSTGAGEGEAKLISTPAIDNAWEAEIGLRVYEQTSYPTVKIKDTLDDHAFADLDRLKRGETIARARVRAGGVTGGDLDPMFGQYHLGDDARLIIEDSPRHPRKADGSPGLDFLTRIIGWNLDPTTDTVDIDFDGTGL